MSEVPPCSEYDTRVLTLRSWATPCFCLRCLHFLPDCPLSVVVGGFRSLPTQQTPQCRGFNTCTCTWEKIKPSCAGKSDPETLTGEQREQREQREPRGKIQQQQWEQWVEWKPAERFRQQQWEQKRREQINDRQRWEQRPEKQQQLQQRESRVHWDHREHRKQTESL